MKIEENLPKSNWKITFSPFIISNKLCRGHDWYEFNLEPLGSRLTHIKIKEESGTLNKNHKCVFLIKPINRLSSVIMVKTNDIIKAMTNRKGKLYLNPIMGWTKIYG
jgi:hypothetical protein